MAFQVSPGVNVSEIDLTTVVPAVSTTVGAIAGPFRWGPIDERVLITDEQKLVERFGKPANTNFETFFTAANFLAYGNQLFVVRAALDSGNTATQNGALNASANGTGVLIKNRDDYEESYISSASGANNYWVGRFAGELGNSLKVSVCDSSNAFSLGLTGSVSVANGNANVVGSGTAFNTQIRVGDILLNGTTVVGKVSAVTNSTALTLQTTYKGDSLSGQSGVTRNWEYFNSVGLAPGTSDQAALVSGVSDQLHVVVVDEDGVWTGTKNTILEVYEALSKGKNARREDGSSNYYIDVINNQSKYVYWGGTQLPASNIGTDVNDKTFGGQARPTNTSLAGGNDGGNKTGVNSDTTIVRDKDLTGLNRGYDLYRSAEDVDISLLLQGAARGGTEGESLANFMIENIANNRKDCLAFISPQRADVVNNTGNELTSIEAFRNALTATSYAVLDSGYKYQYDKYNDFYRYVPLNGDVAGCCVRTDTQRDAWFSPAGFTRGGIKNVTKLAFNPSKGERDFLYKRDVNPVVTFPGQGTILFGDKTLLGQPSAFDRINVRRLFIVLEKAIATASQFSLFEFNDEFTRAQFRNLVEPFLRDVQGRRGIYDFRVVCDETNNTGEVIDRNEFVGDIYIKPARSINFIQLNFVAVRSGVEFSEVVGQF